MIKTDFPPGMQIAQLHHDGTPIELDLFKGTQVPAGGGQLQTWNLDGHFQQKCERLFDWKVQLHSGGSGYRHTDDEFAFEAPQSGYQPALLIDMPATNQN